LLPLSTHEQSAAESVVLSGVPSRTTLRLTSSPPLVRHSSD